MAASRAGKATKDPDMCYNYDGQEDVIPVNTCDKSIGYIYGKQKRKEIVNEV